MVQLDWDDIQGNVLRGYGFQHARHGVLAVTDPAAGRRWLRELLPEITPATPWTTTRPDRAVNVAFTHRGLATLTPEPDALSFPTDFRQGMGARATTHLRDEGIDSPGHWEPEGVHHPRAHVLLMVHSRSADSGEALFTQAIAAAEAHGLELLATEELRNLPNQSEHFGFADGISQPAIEGAMEPTTVRGNGTPLKDGSWQPVRTGEFVLGYADEEEEAPPLPSPTVLARNGSYLVYRKLAQDVAAYRRLVAEHARRHEVPAELVGAKLVGRHADGAPLVSASGASEGPNEATAGAHPSVRLNDVRYEDDMLGQVCPVGSHIRRANPRDGFGLAPKLVSRHRLLRRGMPYGPPLPEGTDQDDEVPRGLLLIAYCASICRQFEFVQSEWLNDGNPFGAGRTTDPIAGHGSANRRFAFETEDGEDPILLDDLPPLVRVMSGEYLFQPGLTALRYLAADD